MSNTDTISLLDLLDSGNFQTYNREIARVLKSVNAAILFSELINRYQYHRNKSELIRYQNHSGEWFYYTIEKCEERTCLTAAEQKSAIKILESKGFFQKKAIGLPAKRHFQLNIEKIIEFAMHSKNVSSSAKFTDLDERNSPNYMSENHRANKEPYKEPNKEPKKNNNPTPSAASQVAPSAVVVFPCLDKLDIPQSNKIKISKHYEETFIENCVDKVLRWETRENDTAAIYHVIKNYDDWEDIPTKEEIEDENRRFLKEIYNKIGDKYFIWDVILGNGYIEFTYASQFKLFQANDSKMKQDLSEFLEKCRESHAEKQEK